MISPFYKFQNLINTRAFIQINLLDDSVISLFVKK